MDEAAYGFPSQKSTTVLMILDLMSDYCFPDGEKVARSARRIAPPIQALKERARAAKLATLYVNDNLGRWRSDLPHLIEHCTRPEAKAVDVVKLLAPSADDYFVFKPRHSAFYATPVAALLEQMGAKRLILTGVTSHQCVLFTANDAHLRNMELIVPSDCIGGIKPGDTRFALKYFSSVLNADTRKSSSLRLSRLRKA